MLTVTLKRFRGLILMTLALFLTAMPAGAAQGPLGIVDDRGGILRAEQVTQLERGLTGLAHPYRIVLERRLPKRFQSSVEMLAHYQPDKAAILIVTGVDDQQTFFAVWPDGPVYQEFKTKAGVPFGTYTDDFLAAYGAEARRGDWVAATLAAVRVIEEKLRVSAPAPAVTPGPAATPTPSVTPTPLPSRSFQPAPTRSEPPLQGTAPRGSAWLGWTASSLAVLTLGAYLLRRFTQRRKALADRQAAQAALLAFDRDTFTGLQSRLVIALGYEGEQSQKAAQGLATALGAATDLDAQAHTHLQEAETLLQRRRYLQASQAFETAKTKLEGALEQLQASVSAWAPFGRVLEIWDASLRQAHSTFGDAGRALASDQARTGWPLDALVHTITQVPGLLEQAANRRDADPLGAMELLEAAQRHADTVLAHLKGLAEVITGLDRLGLAQSDAADLVQQVRNEAGLRFTEDSPDACLQTSRQIGERTRKQHLPAGETPRAEAALREAEGLVDRARSIVEQTRAAREALPGKLDAAGDRVRQIQEARALSERLLGQLKASYAIDHWSDLAHLPAELAELANRTVETTATAKDLGDTEVQKYLQAVRLVDERLAEWEHLAAAAHTLQLRPDSLAQRRRQIEAALSAAEGDLSKATVLSARPGLTVPSSTLERLRETDEQTREVAVSLRPPAVLHLDHLERQAAALGEAAGQLCAELEHLVRQAEEARMQYDAALARAAVVRGYRSYHRSSAAQLDGSLAALQAAMLAGQYDQVLRHAQVTEECCLSLQRAYADHQHSVQAQAQASWVSSNNNSSSSTPSSPSSSGGFNDDAGGGGGWGKN